MTGAGTRIAKVSLFASDQWLEIQKVLYIIQSSAICSMTCVQVRKTRHGMFQRGLFGRQNLEVGGVNLKSAYTIGRIGQMRSHMVAHVI